MSSDAQNLNFIIIGAPKSASTWVHQMLNLYPEIEMPQDEISFFSNAKDLDKIVKKEQVSVFGIRHSDYLWQPGVPHKIKTFGIVAIPQFMCILREPIDRAISSYYWFAQLGFIPNINVNYGIRKIINGEWETRYPRSKEIIEVGNYHLHLSKWFDIFPMEQFLIIFQSEIKNDAACVYRKLCEFLNVNNYLPENRILQRRPKKGVYHPFRIALHRLRNRLLYDYEEPLNGFSRKITPSRFQLTISNKLLKIDRRLGRFFKMRRPVLSADLLVYLERMYTRSNLKLAELLDIKLPGSWQYDLENGKMK